MCVRWWRGLYHPRWPLTPPCIATQRAPCLASAILRVRIGALLEKTWEWGKGDSSKHGDRSSFDSWEEACPETSDGTAKPAGGDLREPDQTMAEQGQDYSPTPRLLLIRGPSLFPVDPSRGLSGYISCLLSAHPGPTFLAPTATFGTEQSLGIR